MNRTLAAASACIAALAAAQPALSQQYPVKPIRMIIPFPPAGERMDRLEEAGVAERTFIVLSADHYPYGLPKKALDELAK